MRSKPDGLRGCYLGEDPFLGRSTLTWILPCESCNRCLGSCTAPEPLSLTLDVLTEHHQRPDAMLDLGNGEVNELEMVLVCPHSPGDMT